MLTGNSSRKPEVWRRTASQHFPTDVEGFEEEEGVQYPPEGQNLSRMVKYIYG